MSAGYAKETGLAFAVGFVNATTSRASTRGIARIYEKNMNAMQFSLILAKLIAFIDCVEISLLRAL